MTEGAKVDLVLHDVDEAIVQRLAALAAARGLTVEQQSMEMLERGLQDGVEEFIREARRLREETRGRGLGSSTDMIREMRDRRVAGEYDDES